MTDIRRLLRLEAESIDPAVHDGQARVRHLARRRDRLRRFATAGLGLVVAAGGLTVGWLAFRGPSERAPSPITASPDTEPSPAPSLPPAPGWFEPSTYRDGDQVVMPVTFPDGTRMELLYPPSLDLAELGINPDTFGAVPGTGCGGNLLIRAFDAKGEIFQGDAPIATFNTPTGARAELWPGKEGWPGHWVVFQFGHWQVLVNCWVSREGAIAGAEQWASALQGRETSDGFLILSGRAPLKLAEKGELHGPELFMEGGTDDTLLAFAPGTHCVNSEPDRGESGVEWCIEGKSAALLVSAYGEDTEFIDSVIDGLEVRGATSP